MDHGSLMTSSGSLKGKPAAASSAAGHFSGANFNGNTMAIASVQGNVTQHIHQYGTSSWPGDVLSTDSGESIDLLLTDISVYSSFHFAKAAAEKLETGTREWLMDMMIDGVNNRPCAVLAADAGMGKSCVMGALAMRRYRALAEHFGGSISEDNSDVGAVHFFQYLDYTDRQATTCVLSLAKQLCVSLPGFRACLPKEDGSTQTWIKTVRKNAAEMKGNSEKQIRYLLSELIIKPCLNLNDHPIRLLLLIDALDECPDANGFSAAVESLWLVDVNRAKSSVPPWLRLIISTRRETNTIVRFKGFQPIVLEQRLEASSTSGEMLAKNMQDLKTVILSRIYMDDVSDDEVVKVILDKSDGIFLWLAYQLDDLRELQSKGKLTKRAVDALPQGLRRVYVDFFNRVRDEFSELEKEHKELTELYDRTLGVGVIAPRAPIPMDTWRSVLGFTATDGYSKLSVLRIESILSRLLIFDSGTGTIRAPHKSMVDFLQYDKNETDRAIASLQIKPLKYHRILGEGLVKQLDELEESRTVMRMGHYTREEAYALHHIVYHLTQGDLLDLASGSYLDLRRLVRLVDEAREESDVSRVILEGRTLLSILEAQQDSYNLPKLRLCLSILQLSQEALAIDARMLPGQMLGRLGMPPYNTERTFFKEQVGGWRAEVKRVGGVVAMPRHPWMSGLSPAGTALEKVLNFDYEVRAVALRGTEEVFVAVGNVVERINLQTGRNLQTSKGHTDRVTSLAISPDSKWVVTGSRDGTARVWNLATGEQVKLLARHSDWVSSLSATVTSVAISSDSKWVVTGSQVTAARLWTDSTDSNTARVWNLTNGEQVKALEGHTDRVTSVAISSDSKWVVTGSHDGTARVWNLATGEQVKVLEGHSHVAHRSNWVIISFTSERTRAVTSVAISPDSKSVVTGSQDKTARVWNLATGEQVKLLEGHSAVVTSVAISSDSKWVVTGSWDGTVRVWNLASGEQVKVFLMGRRLLTSVALSSDSKWVVTGDYDGTARVWNLATEEQIKAFEGHSSVVTSVAISSDSMWVVTGSRDQTASVWNLASGDQVKVLEGHSAVVTSVAISSDSKWVVTGSRDQTARVWNLASEDQVKVLEGHSSVVTSVAISSDSAWVVTGSRDQTARVWNLASGDQIKVLEGHSSMVTSVAISSDSKWVVTGSYDRTARVWNLASGDQVKVLDSGRLTSEELFVARRKWLERIDLRTGRKLQALNTDRVASVDISSDSKWVVTGSGDYTARVRSLASGEQVKPLDESSHEVISVAISSNSKWVVTVSKDNTARVWSLASGERVEDRTPDSLSMTSPLPVSYRHFVSSMPTSVGTLLDAGLMAVQLLDNTVFGATGNDAIFCWSLV